MSAAPGTAIRPAAAAEADAVVALWRSAGLTRPWNDPRTDFTGALGSPTSTVLVADDGAGLVGSVMAGFDGHRGWIYYLATSPAARGRGIARALVAAAEQWLAELGARKVQIMVRTGNPAESLYPHLGYERQETTVWGRWLEEGSGA
ncbi:GCN5-related protein N-acetyltransferase [Beutenbergia cavernae DSM 12333]|uniref:GCN5-related protein N-acetyltransferase n=1 Tax=Beutenbergia cavernae (strain ATCC BAA-8 / DSM 12333 / CCUG 43141 / JCM 11478 / NBRC 16432 / NCIMB 13614 / HKI 0122) TaxID=471853 RepID=C5BZW6_BEUC1|nr:GNAT family acetyltransferase [Beutenbergia cavernae]ACQ81296.1 GCN5-related protein N-acetyltransferase [Beutenbergia cavernae DSM 12333]